MTESAGMLILAGVAHVPSLPDVVAAPWWLALVPILPLAACVLCGLCAAARVRTRLAAWISVACLGGSFLVALLTYGQWVRASDDAPAALVQSLYCWLDVRWGEAPGQRFLAEVAFYVDGLAALWMLFVAGLGTLIALYSAEYMVAERGAAYARYFAAFTLFVFAMLCLVLADNLVLLYLGWEGVGLCSYLLIGYYYRRPSAVAAAKKAFIVNRIGDLGLALGIWLIFTTFGSVRYADILAHADFQRFLALAREGAWDQIPWTVRAIPFLIVAGAFGKSAQFPLYVWLPDAMEGPTPVSALIHAATMVTAGVFLVARTMWIFELSPGALATVAGIGAFTALLAATIGMAQFDLKRIWAYSTISQLGFMFAALGVLEPVAAGAHVFTHAFFKALLFLAAGAVMHGFAGQLDLRCLSGLHHLPGWRLVSVAMLVGCLNLAGFPIITGGFWSKDMILAAPFAGAGPAWAPAVGLVLVLTAGLTAYYTFRVYFRVFLGPIEYHPGEAPGDNAQADHAGGAAEAGIHSPGGHQDFHPHAPGWAIRSVLLILVVLTFVSIPMVLGAGRHGGWVGGLVHASTAHVPTPHGSSAAGVPAVPRHGPWGDPHAWMPWVSAVVGLLGLLVAYRLHLAGRTSAGRARADDLVAYLGPLPRWVRNKWYVDELYDVLFRFPLRALAVISYYFDTYVIDGCVSLAGWLPRGLGAVLRPAQGGALHGYALAMAIGAGVLLLLVLAATGWSA